MKIMINVLLLLLPVVLAAQGKSEIWRITYQRAENGQDAAEGPVIYYEDGMVYLSRPDERIRQYTDLNHLQNITTLTYPGKTYGLVTPFDELPAPDSAAGSSIEILGYPCRYASYNYFSNKVEVWYTIDSEAKGSPYNKFIPDDQALVLRVLINGNRSITAGSVSRVDDPSLITRYSDSTQLVSKSRFEALKIESRYRRLTVFDDDTVNFDPALVPPDANELHANQTYHFSKGSVILKKIKLTPEMKNSEMVFAKLYCRSDGDAYDRTGSVFMITPADDSVITVMDAYLYGLDTLPVFTDNHGNRYQGIVRQKDYTPPAELMRFFTSFGAGHFGNLRPIAGYTWADSVLYKQDVTSLIPTGADEIWIGVFIGNYDSGGHIVSLELDFHPGTNDSSTSQKFIRPLFSTVNTLEMSGQNYGRLFNNDTLEVQFDVPAGIQDLQLLYTTTGHGGWGGGDEFNPKLNRVVIDGTEVFRIIPWRTDCATYRLSNPASGNFENGISSSDLSRSNWCPGTLTPPYIIPLSHIAPGPHTLRVIIDQGADAGSSFSHWSVTGVLTGVEAINGDD